LQIEVLSTLIILIFQNKLDKLSCIFLVINKEAFLCISGNHRFHHLSYYLLPAIHIFLGFFFTLNYPIFANNIPVVLARSSAYETLKQRNTKNY